VEYFDIPGPLLMSGHCPKSLYTTDCGMILNISFQTVHISLTGPTAALYLQHLTEK